MGPHENYLENYRDDLNQHIYKIFSRGANNLPSQGVYCLPCILSDEQCKELLEFSDLYKLLNFVYCVHLDLETNMLNYIAPNSARYDKAIITLSHNSDTVQIAKVIKKVKES